MKLDAVVVGSGPNGLSAAIALAQSGRSVKVIEAMPTIGGGTRSEELTLSGFTHDLCSAVHPLGISSPFFRTLDLERFGLNWVHSEVLLAHPLESGDAVLLHSSVEETASGLSEDAESYLRLMQPLIDRWEELFAEVLQPLGHWPRHPLLLAQFGLRGFLDADTFIRRNFRGARARALFAGIAAHSNAPLNTLGTTAIGLMLNLAAHARGWPIAAGGSQKIADALAYRLRSLGGEIETGREVRSLRDIPQSRLVFFDLTPKQILSTLGDRVGDMARMRLSKYKYGPGVFKMDWALSGPIPWTSKDCLRSATVHLGGSFEEIAESERDPVNGRHPQRPYVLLSQPSLFDSSRAPEGKHTAWAYCHVPNNSSEDMTQIIERQVERFAPGFKNRILKRSSVCARDLNLKNANLVGGDISGGAVNFRQLLFRPLAKLNPYSLPIPGFYVCSASTPPGPGVHGMCGFNAVRAALRANR